MFIIPFLWPVSEDQCYLFIPRVRTNTIQVRCWGLVCSNNHCLINMRVVLFLVEILIVFMPNFLVSASWSYVENSAVRRLSKGSFFHKVHELGNLSRVFPFPDVASGAPRIANLHAARVFMPFRIQKLILKAKNCDEQQNYKRLKGS